MKEKVFIVSLLFSCILHVYGQEKSVFSNGELSGDLSRVEGSEHGKSISHGVSEENLFIDFSGEESWGRVFLKSEAVINTSEYKYMYLKMRVDTSLILEEVGCGDLADKGERLRKIKLDKNWTTILMEVPKTLPETNYPFVLASVQKAKYEFAFIKFLKNVPENLENTIVLISAPEERIEGAKYIFGDGIEFGAPSGYSGENNGSSMVIDDHCMESPYRGKYCIKFSIDDSEAWRALFLQAMGKWSAELPDGTQLESLEAYSKLVFYARTPDKSYVIPEVNFGASSNRFSQEPRSIVYVELENEWKRFEIDIRGLERSSVNDVMSMSLVPGVFYLDEIRFEK